MIPGWSQTAAQFKHQIEGLSNRYRVIALDMRGYGESEKPTHGYRIHRLSNDVNEFLVANNLSNMTLGADRVHDMIRQSRVPRIVLIVLALFAAAEAPAQSGWERVEGGPGTTCALGSPFYFWVHRGPSRVATLAPQQLE